MHICIVARSNFPPHVRLGGLGGLELGQNPKYPSQTRCLAKFMTKNVILKAFLTDFQTCLRHFSERCPTQIFGAVHVWSSTRLFMSSRTLSSAPTNSRARGTLGWCLKRSWSSTRPTGAPRRASADAAPGGHAGGRVVPETESLWRPGASPGCGAVHLVAHLQSTSLALTDKQRRRGHPTSLRVRAARRRPGIKESKRKVVGGGHAGHDAAQFFGEFGKW